MKSTLHQPYKHLKDKELLKLTTLAAKNEKDATLALLAYLVEVDERRLYTTVNACSSLFQYLVKELGLSESAAGERVNAVRLMRAIPEVKEHLETGELTLTSAAQIQRFVNTEQKAHPNDKAVSVEEKRCVVNACLGKSKREVEKTLLEKYSEPARHIAEEKIRLVSSERSEIKFTVDEKTLLKLQKLRNLIGDQSLETIFDSALDALLLSEQKKRGRNVADHQTHSERSLMERETHASTQKVAAPHFPAERKSIQNRKTSETQTQFRTEAQLNSRFIPIHLKRLVFERSQGQCEFMDPVTKKRCDSQFRLQIDHIIPIAMRGKTEASNLRHLCSMHNLRSAHQAGLKRPATAVKH